MIGTPVAERYTAYCELLAQPDPLDLPRRGHERRLNGNEQKQESLRCYVERAYVSHRLADSGRHDAVITRHAQWGRCK